jgi:hypothetical protein
MLTGFPPRTGVRRPTPSLAALLQLAAAPVFLSLAAVVAAGESRYPMCSAAHATFSLGGMSVMYLLMGVFHGPAWLNLIAQLHPRTGRGAAATAAGARPQYTQRRTP